MIAFKNFRVASILKILQYTQGSHSACLLCVDLQAVIKLFILAVKIQSAG